MKVLFATHFFPPGHAGGTESYTLGLAQQLRAQGHQPYVVCAEHWGEGTSWHPRARDTDYAGLPVRRLSWNWELAPDPFLYLYTNPPVEKCVATYLAELQPDVMHITSCYALGAGIIRAARDAGVPTVLTLTDFWFISPRQTLTRGDGTLCEGPESAAKCIRCMAGNTRAYRIMTRALSPELVSRRLADLAHLPLLARRRGMRGYVGDVPRRHAALRAAFGDVNVAIAPSQALKDVYVRNGYPAERLLVSRYGLDLTWVADLQPRPEGAPLCIGYVGQIEPIKGVDVLIEAFRMLDRPDIQLKVFGGLDKNPFFARQLADLADGAPNIQFMGQFDRADIGTSLSQIDVLVVPSVWMENAPVVIAEAFAARKPVIATDLPGISELVRDGVNGLLFPRGDAAALARSLRHFAEDTVLRRRLVDGIPAVRSIEEEGRALEDLYAGLRSDVARTR